MRDLTTLDQYRDLALEAKAYGEIAALGSYRNVAGCFKISSCVDGKTILVFASRGYAGWDHASISREKRTPTWGKMEQIRRLFFEDHEAVMQYHAPVAEYVDGSRHGHPYCLHLWRPTQVQIPKPPVWMVGGMTREEAERIAISEGH